MRDLKEKTAVHQVSTLVFMCIGQIPHRFYSFSNGPYSHVPYTVNTNVSCDVGYSGKERWSHCSLLQFVILSVLTVPAILAHSHVPVMRGLKETTAVCQVCPAHAYTLYIHTYCIAFYCYVIAQEPPSPLYIDSMAHYTIFTHTAHTCMYCLEYLYLRVESKYSKC